MADSRCQPKASSIPKPAICQPKKLNIQLKKPHGNSPVRQELPYFVPPQRLRQICSNLPIFNKLIRIVWKRLNYPFQMFRRVCITQTESSYCRTVQNYDVEEDHWELLNTIKLSIDCMLNTISLKSQGHLIWAFNSIKLCGNRIKKQKKQHRAGAIAIKHILNAYLRKILAKFMISMVGFHYEYGVGKENKELTMASRGAESEIKMLRDRVCKLEEHLMRDKSINSVNSSLQDRRYTYLQDSAFTKSKYSRVSDILMLDRSNTMLPDVAHSIDSDSRQYYEKLMVDHERLFRNQYSACNGDWSSRQSISQSNKSRCSRLPVTHTYNRRV